MTNYFHSAVIQITQAVAAASQRQQPVLLLLSGGSAAQLIPELFSALEPYQLQLTISLADERYVAIGSEASNWSAVDAVRNRLPDAQFWPILRGENRSHTAAAFDGFLQDAIHGGSSIIGLMGIGADGHIAGIKPHSPACESMSNAIGFRGDDFERITITGRFFEKITHVTVYAQGIQKAFIIDKLQQDIAPVEMPAQYVKQAANYKIVYNNEVAV